MTGQEICYIIDAARREGYELGVRQALEEFTANIPPMRPGVPSLFTTNIKGKFTCTKEGA